MSQETPDSATTVEQHVSEATDYDTTGNVILTVMTSGLVGTVLMLSVLADTLELLDLLTTEPITRFAGMGAFFDYESTLALGVSLFGIGGIVVLLVTFVVGGAFLLPEPPRYLRDVSFATLYRVGSVPAFWPFADALVIASFLVFSSLACWVYDLSLGYLFELFADTPQHEV